MSESARPRRDETSIVEALLPYQQPIGRALTTAYQDKLANSQGEPGDIVHETDDIFADMAANPGKMLRGALAWVAYESFGGTDNSVGRQAAVAMEEMQNALLVIDDENDKSPLRRGIPTPHERYRAYIEDRGGAPDPVHTANSLAVNAGVKLLMRAMHSISMVPTENHEAKNRAIEIMARYLEATCDGQLYDLVSSTNGLLSEEAIAKTYTLKTAYYSIVIPLQVGAVLAGARQNDLNALEEFGIHAGLAYQLKDDLLGMFGDPEQTGKPIYSDLEEGTMTSLLNYALKNANEHDRALLQLIRGSRVTEDRQEAVRRILSRPVNKGGTGAQEYIEQKAMEQIGLARAVLDAHAEWDAKGVIFLQMLLQYILLRNK